MPNSIATSNVAMPLDNISLPLVSQISLICSTGKEVDFKLGMGTIGIEHYDRLTQQGI